MNRDLTMVSLYSLSMLILTLTPRSYVFLGVIVTALWTIIEFGIMADCYIMPASLSQ